MDDVLKAGILEVTVVQAIGVGLHGSGKAFSRGRRKPAIQARVTVDGTTKTGPSAPRSHHPVWFPAPPEADNSAVRARQNPSWGARNEYSSKVNRDVGSLDGSLGRAFDSGDAFPLPERARGRYTSGAYGGAASASGGGGGGGSVGAGDTVGVGHSRSGGNVGRGLLFDVREFYGPCRILVELVSGGGPGGGTGSGGGTVLGKCEARLAEALVGRGGSVSSSSSSLVKGSMVGPVNQAPAAPFAAIPETPPPRDPDVLDGGFATPVSFPSQLPPGDSLVRDLSSPAVDPGATSMEDVFLPTRWSSCLPGTAMFGRWRRRVGDGNGHSRHARGRSASADGSAIGAPMSGDESSSVGGASSRSVGTRQSSMRPWRRSKPSQASKKCVGEPSRSSTHWVSLEEAEALAVNDWGDRDSCGGPGAAKDLWKELSPPGGGGKGAATGTKGTTLGVSAVRVRLRFVPLWDCLVNESDGGVGDGLGALHAAAHDGDWRMVKSLVLLWETLSDGAQPLTRKCRRGLTPIQHCIEAGKEVALRELLHTRHGTISIQAAWREGEDTALHTAIKSGEERMLKMLLAFTRRSDMSHTRMPTARRFGMSAPQSSFVDTPGADGLTPLALAALYGNDSMVKCLLEEGADASKTDARGMTSLAHAAQGGKLLAVRALLKAKTSGTSGVPGVRRSRLAKMACTPCKTNEDGMAPLALAAAGGWHQVVSELIRAGVPYRTRDLAGKTPLHHAAAGGHMSVLKVLVDEMQKGKIGSVAGPGGCSSTMDGMGLGGHGAAGERGEDSALGRHHTLMMDGGPFKLSNLDLAGRTAHATALLNKQHQAAAYLEAVAAELELNNPGEAVVVKGRARGANGSKGKAAHGSKCGQHARSKNASPLMKTGQGSSSGSGAWSGSGSGSGTPCRPSPLSSAGMDSAGSAVESEDLSYEYCGSDRE